MRVPEIPIAFSARRTATSVALFLAIGVLNACDAFKPVEACTVTIAPGTLTMPVNGTAQVVGTAFDCDGNSIAKKTVNFSSSNSLVATVTPGGVVIGVGVGAATISATADGKTGSAPVTVTPELTHTVTVTPSSATLRIGNALKLTAVAKNVAGTVITGRTFVWTSSNSSVAIVDQTGQVTALTTGQVVVTAQSDQQTGAANLLVTLVPIGSCTLSPISSKLTVGQQVQPTLALKDTAGNTISSVGRQIVWTSNNEIVATVSTTGLVTTRRAGNARITAASFDNPAITCPFDVEAVDPRIATVVISPRTGTLRIAVPRQFSVQMFDSVGGAIPPGRIVTWKNPTPTIATISASGLVTGIALGTAKIAVQAEGAVDTVSLVVTKVPVATVSVAPLQSSIIQGGTTQLTATVTDSTGTIVTDRPVEWQSNDLSKALVSQTGLVTGLAPGNVSISATSEGRSGSGSVIIQQIPVDSIAADSTYTMIKNAQNASFAIRLLDAQGNQIFNRSVSISSSQPGIALGNANAQANVVTVTGLNVGETILSLRALNVNNQPEGKTTRVRVTVNPIPPP